MATIATLGINVVARTNALEKGLRQARRSMGRFTSSVGASIKRMAAFAGVGASLGGLGFAVKLAAQSETLDTALNIVIKDLKVTKKLVADINAFSAITPFEPGELKEAAQGLVSAQVAVSQIVPSLKMLGDAAAGSNSRLIELVRIFTKVKGATIINREQINQFTDRSIPLMQELAKMFGKSTQEILAMATAGKISFDDMQKALGRMTSEGGIFADAMEKQSKTLAGVWSTLTGNLKLFGEQLGNKLLPLLKAAAGTLNEFTIWMQGIDTATLKTAAQIAVFAGSFAIALVAIKKIITVVRVLIGAYKAMTIAQAIAQAFGGPAGWATLAASAAIAGAAVVGVTKAFGAVNKSLDESQKKAKDAAKAKGELTKALDAVKESTAAVTVATDEMLSKGAQITESMRTPIEQFSVQMDDLDKLLEVGAISWQTYGRAVKKAQNELNPPGEPKKAPEARKVGALARGTVGAFSAEQTHRLQNQLVNFARRNNIIQQRQADLLTTIDESIHETADSITVNEVDL